MFKLGLIINPFAGIGGRVGLKGSDGEKIRDRALALGGKKLAQKKTAIALEILKPLADKLKVFTVSGEMGQDLCQAQGFESHVILNCASPSTEKDTIDAVKALEAEKVDLILFAGGDGTARNIYQACQQDTLVLGIPAGVKIHSGVYAISPKAAGLLVKDLVEGKILSLLSADVVDIDEQAFRAGRVSARKYGDLSVPAALEYVQAVKNGGQEVEALVLDDIAADIVESMDDDVYYVIGSGSTCAAIMQLLGLPNTLLGSDIVINGQLFKTDAVERDFLELLNADKPLKFVITVIGGQGHILGRGNQQLSPSVIRQAGWDNFQVVASKGKLKTLDGRPLLVDTGDTALDEALSGRIKVITGYHDSVLYPVGIT